MKNIIFYSLVLMLLNSCSKQESASQSQNHEVTYEVLTSSGEWFGEWFDEKKNRTVMTAAPWNKSGWTVKFKPTIYPFELMCHATSTCSCFGTATSPDVTVNLYIDGKLVKTEKNNFAKGVTTATFVIE